MKILIFANGSLTGPQPIVSSIQPGDILIAADGGAKHCQALGIIPQFVIGDFDSLTQTELEKLHSIGTKLIRYPARKDFTDLELAVEFACQLGGDEIIVYGGLGQRWDQTLANILLLAKYSDLASKLRLLDGDQEIMIVDGSRPLEIHGEPGDTISLIPVAGDAEGVSTLGLEYPLSGETLFFGSTRGISNVLIQETGSIKLKKGKLICTLIRNGS